ncbi:hypothetical protein HUJ05_010653 [Dendroctonus ponderosae]|nr:hypothetical protein HUJ05_010653 [Dendroctonus ponderosae]
MGVGRAPMIRQIAIFNEQNISGTAGTAGTAVSGLSNEKKSANESARTRLLIRRAYKHLCINIMNLLRMRMRMRMLLAQYWTFVNATIDKGYSQITDRNHPITPLWHCTSSYLVWYLSIRKFSPLEYPGNAASRPHNSQLLLKLEGCHGQPPHSLSGGLVGISDNS